MNHAIFSEVDLDGVHKVFLLRSHRDFTYDPKQFNTLWDQHPDEYHIIKMRGKEIRTPRWQQAYGKSYNYSGTKNVALPISAEMAPFLSWAQKEIDPRLNGLLLNWYDGEKSHYIGAHRDDTKDLHRESPIVTISLGEERIFRLRKIGTKGVKIDVPVRNGDVLVVPWETNWNFTHEVPKFKKYINRRISVTLRAYRD